MRIHVIDREIEIRQITNVYLMEKEWRKIEIDGEGEQVSSLRTLFQCFCDSLQILVSKTKKPTDSCVLSGCALNCVYVRKKK